MHGKLRLDPRRKAFIAARKASLGFRQQNTVVLLKWLDQCGFNLRGDCRQRDELSVVEHPQTITLLKSGEEFEQHYSLIICEMEIKHFSVRAPS